MIQEKRASGGAKASRKRNRLSSASPETPARTKSLVWPAYVSALFLWMSFPPLGLGWLAWLAPLGWLQFVQRSQALTRKDYLHLWFSGCLFWLALLQGIRLAYWPLYLGGSSSAARSTGAAAVVSETSRQSGPPKDRCPI